MLKHRKNPHQRLFAEIARSSRGAKRHLHQAVIFLGLTLSLSSAAVDPPDSEGRKLISGIVLHHGVGGAKLEISGKADMETSRAITADTPFLIGSASKTFAAVAILTLVDQKLVTLTDPVRKYFPESPAAWLADPKGVPTIHHLLSHTSGIPEAYNEAIVEEKLFRDKLTFEQLFAAISHRSLIFSPGKKFAYSNTGYIILGEIIRRVSQQSYGEYLQQSMFAPLGMQQTTVGSPLANLAALSYVLIHGKSKEYQRYFEINEKHVDDTFVDGNIYSSANDLLLWMRALFSGKILSSASLQAMLTNHSSGYGYGINIKKELPGTTIYDHEGEWIGYHALIRFIPKTTETYILLENLIP